MSTNRPLLSTALETEQYLLGTLLLQPIGLPAARILRPDDFTSEANATIFTTICQLEADGLPINLPTLTTRLERSGLLQRVGGPPYLTSLLLVPSAARNIPAHVERLVRAAISREELKQANNLPADTPRSAATGRPLAQPGPAFSRAAEPPRAISPEQARAQLADLAPTLRPIQNLLSQAFAPTHWMIPDLLPEGLTLLASKPKLGKSWLALGLALAVAAGGVALGQIEVEPGAALYLALEDSEKRLHARTQQLLRGEPLSGSLDVTTHWPRLDENGLAQLELWLQGHPNARLIILDTLARIRGRARGGASLYGSDYAALEGVQALAHRYQVAILVIHHTGKASRADPLDEVNATQGLNGVADNILVLRRQRGKADATLVGDGRELSGIELSLHFDAAACTWAITEPPAPEASTPERTQILRVLQASPEPMTPMQVAQMLGKNINTTRTLLTRMSRDGELTMIRYGKYITNSNTVNSVNSVNSVQDDEGENDEASDPPVGIQKSLSRRQAEPSVVLSS